MSKRRAVQRKNPVTEVPPESYEISEAELSFLQELKNSRPAKAGAGRRDRVMPLLPLRGEVVYPNTIVPIVINRTAGIALVDAVTSQSDRNVILATQVDLDAEVPTRKDLADIACVGQILQMLKFPDGSTRIVFQGIERVKLGTIQRQEPFPTASVKMVNERKSKGLELEALVLHARKLLNRMVKQTQ